MPSRTNENAPIGCGVPCGTSVPWRSQLRTPREQNGLDLIERIHSPKPCGLWRVNRDPLANQRSRTPGLSLSHGQRIGP